MFFYNCFFFKSYEIPPCVVLYPNEPKSLSLVSSYLPDWRVPSSQALGTPVLWDLAPVPGSPGDSNAGRARERTAVARRISLRWGTQLSSIHSLWSPVDTPLVVFRTTHATKHNSVRILIFYRVWVFICFLFVCVLVSSFEKLHVFFFDIWRMICVRMCIIQTSNGSVLLHIAILCVVFVFPKFLNSNLFVGFVVWLISTSTQTTPRPHCFAAFATKAIYTSVHPSFSIKWGTDPSNPSADFWFLIVWH